MGIVINELFDDDNKLYMQKPEIALENETHSILLKISLNVK